MHFRQPHWKKLVRGAINKYVNMQGIYANIRLGQVRLVFNAVPAIWAI